MASLVMHHFNFLLSFPTPCSHSCFLAIKLSNTILLPYLYFYEFIPIFLLYFYTFTSEIYKLQDYRQVVQLLQPVCHSEQHIHFRRYEYDCGSMFIWAKARVNFIHLLLNKYLFVINPYSMHGVQK